MSKISDDQKNGVAQVAGKMVLVPVEPTAEMRSAAYECAVRFNRGRSIEHIGSVALDSQSIYRAMIAAAPALTNTDLSLRAENERLRKIIWDGEAAMWGVHEKGFVMGPLIHRPSIGQIIADLKAKLEEAAKVLEPFAETAEHDIGLDENDSDTFQPMTNHNSAAKITVGNMRAAKSFLANLKGAE